MFHLNEIRACGACPAQPAWLVMMLTPVLQSLLHMLCRTAGASLWGIGRQVQKVGMCVCNACSSCRAPCSEADTGLDGLGMRLKPDLDCWGREHTLRDEPRLVAFDEGVQNALIVCVNRVLDIDHESLHLHRRCVTYTICPGET